MEKLNKLKSDYFVSIRTASLGHSGRNDPISVGMNEIGRNFDQNVSKGYTVLVLVKFNMFRLEWAGVD